MLSFSGFRLEDGSPIYQQIIRYLEQGIAAGTIRDGDGLPSRRVLSAQLGVNPNTVQKACRMLEEAGLITSRSGAKSDFTLDEAAVAAVRTRLMEREAAALVRSLRQMGLTRPEAEALIDRLWDSPELEEEKPLSVSHPCSCWPRGAPSGKLRGLLWPPV